jgi:hypothetical protein
LGSQHQVFFVIEVTNIAEIGVSLGFQVGKESLGERASNDLLVGDHLLLSSLFLDYFFGFVCSQLRFFKFIHFFQFHHVDFGHLFVAGLLSAHFI